MSSCCCNNTKEKNYEKEEKAQVMSSADLQRKREYGISYFANHMRIYDREQYLSKQHDFTFVCVIYLEKSTSNFFPGFCFLKNS